VADRETLEARVSELADAHHGPDFVTAVEQLAAGLDAGERALLEEILLDRSADGFRDAIAARVEAQGWLRRQWSKLDPDRPPRA
jgi:hypothetical protein